MIEKINKKILFSLLIFITLILISAFLIEYGLGYKPCKLCIYQRIPYFVAILLILTMLFATSYQKIALCVLALTFLASSSLAFYHFGIEQGFFNESLICKAENPTDSTTINPVIMMLHFAPCLSKKGPILYPNLYVK